MAKGVQRAVGGDGPFKYYDPEKGGKHIAQPGDIITVSQGDALRYTRHLTPVGQEAPVAAVEPPVLDDVMDTPDTDAFFNSLSNDDE